MIVVPSWITFAVAGLVIVFGAYRLWIGLGGQRDQPHTFRQRGLYALPRRRHVLFGVLYLAMGGLLIASAFGFKPW